MSGEFGFSGGTSRGDNNHDQSTSEKNNYVVKPPTFSGYCHTPILSGHI